MVLVEMISIVFSHTTLEGYFWGEHSKWPSL